MIRWVLPFYASLKHCLSTKRLQNRDESLYSTRRFILLQNRAGKTRLSKYYVPIDDSEKRKLEYEVHRLVVNRDPKHTNFVEVRDSCVHGRHPEGSLLAHAWKSQICIE